MLDFDYSNVVDELLAGESDNYRRRFYKSPDELAKEDALNLEIRRRRAVREDDWVLWGKHPAYVIDGPLKICGGTLKQCSDSLRTRKSEEWDDLWIDPNVADYRH
jgi:hypothetical protein